MGNGAPSGAPFLLFVSYQVEMNLAVPYEYPNELMLFVEINRIEREGGLKHNSQRMKPNTRRFLALILLAFVAALFAVPTLAQLVNTNPPAGDTNPPVVIKGFDATALIIPAILGVLAPALVAGLKKIPGWFESKVSKNWLPYVCLGVALVLTVIMDLMGKISIPLWITVPLVGAIGVGARELLTRGIAILTGGGNPPPADEEATKATITAGPPVDK